MLKIAEVMSPRSAAFMIRVVILGKLYERIVSENAAPPIKIGSQPRRKIIRALVGLE